MSDGEADARRGPLGLRRSAERGETGRPVVDEQLVDPLEPILLADGEVVLDRGLRIPTRDGTTLSACVYRPSRSGPFPTIVEYLPYRKDDVTAPRDRMLLPALAERGFACVRIDVRGTGDSDGIALDEYTEQEQEDGVDALAWIRQQHWSTGALGAWGNSYGGFTAIHLAARRPPGLAAIAAVQATDDRYTDDMHFYGGALCALELAHYPVRMLAMNALPPTRPLDEKTRELWLDRIERTPPWVLCWLEEQHDGPYWRNGSLRPHFDRLECPVLLVGGWRDGYCNSAVRMAAELPGRSELVVGPWPHVRPNLAPIPPRLDFVELLAGWFAKHLRGEGEERDDRALVFVQGYDSPLERPRRITGEWRRLEGFPHASQETAQFHPTVDGWLAQGPGARGVMVLDQVPHAGVQMGNWAYPPPPDGLPGDQRLDEVYALTFTTTPLVEELVVAGFPRLTLSISHPGPTAVLAAKLCDVAPEGVSQLVTRGVLNLSHRHGHERPEPLEPGFQPVELELNATAWRFAPGHRIRLAVASNDWSTVWPPATAQPLLVRIGEAESELVLPLCPEGEVVDVPEPTEELPPWETFSRTSPPGWRVVRDGLRCRTGIETTYGREFVITDSRTSGNEARSSWATVDERDPLSAGVEGWCSFHFQRPDAEVRTTARGRFTCTEESFRARLELEVELDGEPFARRYWDEEIPRKLV
jgi:putative CocE/NonD family hydrolase